MSIEERREERKRTYYKYRAFADARGVTDYRVSQDTGLHNVVFSEWKSGKSQPKQDKLKKLADYFNTTVDALIAK